MAQENYTPYGFWPANCLDEGCCVDLPIKANQTLAVGDPVIWNTGQIAVAVSDSSTELAGVVAQDCSNLAAGTKVKVWADPSMVFRARSSAAPSSITAPTGYDLSGTTGAFELNVAATSQALFKFRRIVPGMDSSEDGCPVEVTIDKHSFADTST